MGCLCGVQGLPDPVGVRRPAGECRLCAGTSSVAASALRAHAFRHTLDASYPRRKGPTMATEELERETAALPDADEVVADELVEDVSIDGMCGVY